MFNNQNPRLLMGVDVVFFAVVFTQKYFIQ